MAPLLDALTGDPAIAARFEPAAEIAAILRFEAELAEAQGMLGILAPETAARVADACRSFTPDEAGLRQGLMRDGVVVPELVRQLRVAAGEAGPKVHLGATSQDAVDTALMLRLADILLDLRERADGLLALLSGLSDRFGTQSLMAQTRMQAALAFTVADKLASWRKPLDALSRRYGELSRSLPVQLGGPIGNGGSFGEDYPQLRAQLAARLGLLDAEPWQSDRQIVLDVAQAFALLSGTLGKVGQDLALMAQNEVGAVKLAGGGSSSAMAHKQNPVGAEVLVSLGRFNAGLLGTLAQSMIHENERSGAAWTLEWLVLPQMAQAAGSACRLAESLLSGLRFVDARDAIESVATGP